MPVSHPDFGRALYCPDCTNLLRYTRLTEEEQRATFDQITGTTGSPLMLRALGAAVPANPRGLVYLWGPHGTAKSQWLWACVAALARRGNRSIYFHAVDLQRLERKDIEGDSNNRELHMRVPVLAIDELDKYQFTDYARSQLQELIDQRYRDRETKLTILASNPAPDGLDDRGREWLPRDIISRIYDGRFRRRWPDGFGEPPANCPDGMIPGVIEIQGADIRPFLESDA